MLKGYDIKWFHIFNSLKVLDGVLNLHGNRS